MPNILLVYPEFPPSYWSFKFALKNRVIMAPLGLLTVAGMFPSDYNIKIIDMNVERLKESHLKWADAVGTSTMIVQKNFLYEVAARCNKARVPIFAGGWHPTSYYEDIKKETDAKIDHFILGEVEETFPEFLRDLKNGAAKEVYPKPKLPSITKTPLPRYGLINLRKYASMAIQFSRGCPFNCDFCDIWKMNGRIPRTKNVKQMLGEFDLLYNLGWRGSVMIVDDNFIGNKRSALEFLPHAAKWQKQRRYPFSFYTEASVNLEKLDEMMELMVEAGFGSVFLGLETPKPNTLKNISKGQNVKAGNENYLMEAVRKIQGKFDDVMAGFILGLDGDDENIFDSQIDFIQEAGIPTAMVGLLTALKETDLYNRLEKEGRIISESEGLNTSITLNFVPQIESRVLIDGFKRVISTLYDRDLKKYFERCLTMIQNRKTISRYRNPIGFAEIKAALKSLTFQLFSKQGPAYAKFLIKIMRDNPRLLPDAIRMAVKGYHFERMTRETIAADDFRQFLTKELDAFRETAARFIKEKHMRLEEIWSRAQYLFATASSRYEKLHKDFRYSVEETLADFIKTIRMYLDELRSEPNQTNFT